MECDKKYEIKVRLPRYSSVKNTILKYSSIVALNTGARFHVWNVCGKKIEAKLSKQHAKHLRTHDKTWKSYKNKLCDNLEESIKNYSKEMETKEDDNMMMMMRMTIPHLILIIVQTFVRLWVLWD